MKLLLIFVSLLFICYVVDGNNKFPNKISYTYSVETLTLANSTVFRSNDPMSLM